MIFNLNERIIPDYTFKPKVKIFNEYMEKLFSNQCY